MLEADTVARDKKHLVTRRTFDCTMATLKVLAIGAVLGSFKSFFSKVKAFDQKHGKFEMVIATGDFFAPEDDTSKEEELIELLEDKLEGD
ncbi:hypothetical protein M422DRAFT_274170 [Sphaerobolus stellatus SS14]|uniref:Uncharacterized protein n=1 Tax=Sphaerobolus stellatus (strain SS14) TaxID=990650 RepID=A0A0C9TT02_SPHS4|nr:hypothetical protein M422DRAFT_274170 [Sphaerobolus stellatus SS14]